MISDSFFTVTWYFSRVDPGRILFFFFFLDHYISRVDSGRIILGYYRSRVDSGRIIFFAGVFVAFSCRSVQCSTEDEIWAPLDLFHVLSMTIQLLAFSQRCIGPQASQGAPFLELSMIGWIL